MLRLLIREIAEELLPDPWDALKSPDTRPDPYPIDKMLVTKYHIDGDDEDDEVADDLRNQAEDFDNR